MWTGIVAQSLVPALGRQGQKQMHHCESEDSPVYKVSYRTARTAHSENLSKKKI